MIFISDAEVLGDTGMTPADVLIEGDRIVAVGSIARPPGAELVDGKGLVLGPGLVDIHVHFRDPGEEWKEDLETGSMAAAAGGYTAVLVMPNTAPVIDTPDLALETAGKGARIGLVHVAVAGAVTRGRRGEVLADIGGMYRAGVRVFSDDGDSVGDGRLLRQAMSVVAGLPGAMIAQHAEDAAKSAGGLMHDGSVARELRLRGLPAGAESDVVARDIEISRQTGAHLHVQHLSTRAAVDLVRSAKSTGDRVTAEVTPHHLTLTEEALRSTDPNLKMYPPLRSEADRAALIDALRRGVIDVVATDHAPHTTEEKDVGFETAPRGVIGLETAMPVVLESLGGDLQMMFERMSLAPARLIGLERHGHPVAPDRPANLVLIDPLARHKAGNFRSRSSNSPFAGRELTGRVIATIYEGRVVYKKDTND